MVYGGARGDTAAQIRDVLHYPLSDEELHRVSNALNLALSSGEKDSNQNNSAFTLQIANALWAMQNGHIEESYLDLLSENYSAGMRTVDFAQSQEAADLINRWAQENTNDKIKKLPTGYVQCQHPPCFDQCGLLSGAWRFRS